MRSPAALTRVDDIHDGGDGEDDDCNSLKRVGHNEPKLGDDDGFPPEAWTWLWLCASLSDLARRWTVYSRRYVRVCYVYSDAS